jgi:pimeloyl-ACP methyl ester carboxylesterase
MLEMTSTLAVRDEQYFHGNLVPNHSSGRRLNISACYGDIRATVCMPKNRSRNRAPLLALHGISRKDGAIIDAFKDVASRTGRVLIVPKFSRKHWPEFQRIGRARPDLAILSLLANLRSEGTIGSGPIDVFGFSGGAQLANRFAMLYPHLIGKLHLAAAGWYCFPDEALPFPAGLGTQGKVARHGMTDVGSAMRAQVEAFLRLPVRVYVGGKDTLRDAALRRTDTIDRAQGLNRLVRAGTFVDAFRAAAFNRGIAPNALLTILPGCGHDFSECAREAALAERVSF